MRLRFRLHPFVALLLLVGPASAAGQVGEEEEPKNLAGLFVGATSSDETSFTLGLLYEREIFSGLGVGALLEHEFGEDNATTFMPVLGLGSGRLSYEFGLGWKFGDDSDAAALRAGLRYEIGLPGNAFLAPTFDVGYADDFEAIWGVVLGGRF